MARFTGGGSGGGSGIPGPRGPQGESAYQIAVENGFVGTEQEWLDSLGGGGSSDIADFVFNYDEEDTDSTMTIHNHDMVIRTTRDDGEDADISIYSADDIWIRSNDTIELESTTDEVRILTGEDSQNEWKFRADGVISSDNNFLAIESLSSEDVKGRLKFEPNNGRALLQAYGNNQTATFTDSWDTATWTTLDPQLSQLTLTNASSIISFMDATGYQVDNLKIAVNGSDYGLYHGAGAGDGAITLYIKNLLPIEEVSVTEVRFQYAFSSKVDIDYDEGDLLIDTQDEMDIVISAADDLYLRAKGDDVFIEANNDITFTANDGSEAEQSWRMEIDGKFQFPAAGYIENGFGNSGDGYGNDTFKIVPDADLTSDQYLIIDPTSPNHIHIRAGGNIDESSAYLILGGETNNVIVSDSDRNVYINSRPPLVMNSYLNTNTESNTSFITGSTADIQNGYTVNVDGIDYIVDGIMPVDEGVVAVTANGAIFNAGQSYTFIYDPEYTNNWQFASNGTLYGPAMGSLKVTGIYGQNDSPLHVLGPNSVVLDGDVGEFLNDPSDPENQIATIGDVANYVDGFLDSSTGTTVEYIDQQDAATLTAANAYADSLVLAAEGFNWRGDYEFGDLYEVNDVVAFENSLYICISNNPPVLEPISAGLPNTSQWQLFLPAGEGFRWRGAYSPVPAEPYLINDIVEVNGTSYISLINNNGFSPIGAPPDTWDLFTQGGFRWTGTWSSMGYNGFSYVAGDVVEYEGSTYLCTPQMGMANSQPPIFGPESPTPGPNPDWELMAAAGEGYNFRGTWSSMLSPSQAYVANDIVLYNGTAYIAAVRGGGTISAGSGTPGQSTAGWEVFVPAAQGFIWKGSWSSMPMTPYVAGDVVSYNSKIYVAQTPFMMSTPAGEGTPGDSMGSGWSLMISSFNWRGEWSSTPNPLYVVSDLVSYRGSTWIAVPNSMNIGVMGTPGSSDSWQIFAAGLRNRGQWASNPMDTLGEYTINDVVSYLGSSYVRTALPNPEETNPPANEMGSLWPNWALIASKGDAGEAPTWRGEWQENADPAYQENDIISYQGSSYIGQQIGAGSWSNPPGGFNDYWRLLASKGDAGANGTSFTWLGEWNGSGSGFYSANSVVSYQGSSYIAKADVPGEPPTNTQYWDLVAQKGDPASIDTGTTTINSYNPVFSGTDYFGPESGPGGTPGRTGSYIKIGNLVQVQIEVDFAGTQDFGSGQYSLTLPFPSLYHTDVYGGSVHNTGATIDHYSLKGHLSANSSAMTLWYISGSSKDEPFKFNAPISLSTDDKFHMAFSYICA